MAAPTEPAPDAVQRLLGARDGEAFLLAHHGEAARRLARCFHRATLRQRVTMSYDPGRVGARGGGGGPGDITADMAEARKRLNLLARQMPADCWSVLVDVCGLERGLQEIELDRNWPRRSAKLVLRIGLDRLAQLLGLDPAGEGPQGSRTRHWLEERLPIIPMDD